ncbi:MAG: hypothetical protein Q9190_005704, partial [Brigantiaea leucoxantha]
MPPSKAPAEAPFDDCPFQVDMFQQLGKHPAWSDDEPHTLVPVYHVSPESSWNTMSRFRSIEIEDQKYYINDIVMINRPLPLPLPSQTANPSAASPTPCIAQIREIKAKDPENCFIRVYWFYEPKDLPSGKQNHHGEHELIATNHMDILRPSHILHRLDVSHWFEEDDPSSSPPKGLYYRQTYSIVSIQLS